MAGNCFPAPQSCALCIAGSRLGESLTLGSENDECYVGHCSVVTSWQFVCFRVKMTENLRRRSYRELSQMGKYEGVAIMNLMEAIYGRRSIRQYRPVTLSAELTEQVQDICRERKPLYEQIPLGIHLVDGIAMQRILPGLVGSYGKVMAPHYLVVTSANQPGYLENVGYTLEQIVLKLTCLGLGTCWIGGRVQQLDLSTVVKMPVGQSPVVLIAVGHPAEGVELLRVPAQAKRKPMTELVLGKPSERWQSVLAAGRMAPSAINIQPWRFIVEGPQTHLFVAAAGMGRLIKSFLRLDAGIALSHIEIAAGQLGQPIRIQKQQEAAHRQWEYVTSIICR